MPPGLPYERVRARPQNTRVEPCPSHGLRATNRGSRYIIQTFRRDRARTRQLDIATPRCPGHPLPPFHAPARECLTRSRGSLGRHRATRICVPRRGLRTKGRYGRLACLTPEQAAKSAIPMEAKSPIPQQYDLFVGSFRGYEPPVLPKPSVIRRGGSPRGLQSKNFMPGKLWKFSKESQHMRSKHGEQQLFIYAVGRNVNFGARSQGRALGVKPWDSPVDLGALGERCRHELLATLFCSSWRGQLHRRRQKPKTRKFAAAMPLHAKFRD